MHLDFKNTSQLPKKPPRQSVGPSSIHQHANMNTAPSPMPEASPQRSTTDFGRDDVRRRALKRLLLTLPPYALAICMALLAMHLKLVTVWSATLVTGCAVLGLGTFFALLASGVSARWRDPMLIFPQLLFGICLVALAYAVMDVTRGVVMEWLALLIVFDMRRLERRQTVLAAALAMVLPALGVIAVWALRPIGGNLHTDLLFLLLSAILVPVLLVVSAAARSVQRRHIELKESLANALEQMRQLSIRDGLTGLYNRRHMLSLLEEEDRRLRRTNRAFCVAMLDIDWFKDVNDRFGHATGDTVLRQFAALGRAAFPAGADALARWGGEEFLLLMPESTAAQAHMALSRMRQLVHAYDWSQHHPSLAITFSAGIAQHHENLGLAQTLAAADSALYRAKGAGRDCIDTSTPLTPEELKASTDVQVVLSVTPTAPNPSSVSLGTNPTSPGTTALELRAPKRSGYDTVVNLLLGGGSKQRSSAAMCLASSAIWLCVMLSECFYFIPAGLMTPEAGAMLLVFDVVGAFVPYALVRSGITRNLKDPAIAFPQMCWALLALVLSYGFVPVGRAYSLQLTCTVLVFSFINVLPRQAAWVGWGTIGMLTLVFGCLLYVQPAEFEPVRDGLALGMTVVVVAFLSRSSYGFALKREKVRRERRELSATLEEVELLTTRDALTGLPNRQYAQSVLERECERQERSGHAFCAALVDLDHFKHVNDNYGHHVGDEVLVGFAQAARNFLRETDLVARWGGEEFLLVFHDTEPGEHGSRACERLRKFVAECKLCPSAPSLVVTLSAGVAERIGSEPLSRFLDRADRALYAAKAQGRNCVCLAEPPEQNQEELNPARSVADSNTCQAMDR